MCGGGSIPWNWLFGSYANEVTICIDNYKWSLLTDLRVLTQTERRCPFVTAAAWGGEAREEIMCPLHSEAHNLLCGQVLAAWCPWAMQAACPAS